LRLSVVGGDEEDRTPDLLNAIQALSQLSYAPTFIELLVTNDILLNIFGDVKAKN
jgi:hypothetical protein